MAGGRRLRSKVVYKSVEWLIGGLEDWVSDSHESERLKLAIVANVVYKARNRYFAALSMTSKKLIGFGHSFWRK